MGNFSRYDPRTGSTGGSPLFDQDTDDVGVFFRANVLTQADRSSAFIGNYTFHSALTARLPTDLFEPPPPVYHGSPYQDRELPRDCTLPFTSQLFPRTTAWEAPCRTKAFQDSCDGPDLGGNNSYRLRPPPISSLAEYTQACFGFTEFFPRNLKYPNREIQWPPPECDPPCITPKDCEPPSYSQRDDAESAVPTIIANTTDHKLSGGGDVDPVVLDRGLTNDEAIFIASAKAILLDNLDLVEWVICFACYLADTPYPQSIADCMLSGLIGKEQRYLYVVDIFPTMENGEIAYDESGNIKQDGATGGATDIFFTSDGGTGVVVPIGHSVWQDAVKTYASAANVGDGASAMAAAAAMSNNILHEMMHLCAEAPNLPAFPSPGLANDRLLCGAIQNMVGISFLWALAQRYPCLQGLDCFPKAADPFFMTSEPTDSEVFPWKNVPC